jgi:two-component system, probable response regulator PhcQ
MSAATYQILIIDDEVEILNALSRLLREPGYVIHCASSAAEALAVSDRTSLDLIISDYMLGPDINGIRLLEKLLDKQKDALCILITGYADMQVALEAINTIGLYKFILKPWDNNDLIITVRRALEQRALIQENRRLVNELRRRESVLEQLEKEHPGITKIRRNAKGLIEI